MRPDGSRIEAEGHQWVFGGGQQAPSPPARGVSGSSSTEILYILRCCRMFLVYETKFTVMGYRHQRADERHGNPPPR